MEDTPTDMRRAGRLRRLGLRDRLSVIRGPGRAQGVARGPALRTGARAGAALLIAAVLGACGGSDDAGQPPPGIGGARIGVPLAVASCRDWKNASAKERLGTLEVLRKFASGRSGSPRGYGRALDDDRAYKLLEASCKPDYAADFRLYKLYTRASAFSKTKLPPQ